MTRALRRLRIRYARAVCRTLRRLANRYAARADQLARREVRPPAPAAPVDALEYGFTPAVVAMGYDVAG